MTLFDVSDLFGSKPLGATGTPPKRRPREAGAGPDGRAAGDPGADRIGDGVPEVEVRISKRRKKTSEAKWVGGRIVVSVPAHLDLASDRRPSTGWSTGSLPGTASQSRAGRRRLLARAIELSDHYLVGARPNSVRWVTNQSDRWGSCSYHSGEIRVSHRLRAVPGWVLDSVLVHEVAHLTHPDHSSAFHSLAASYPRHEEAGVFLAGYGLGLSNPLG